MKTCRIKHFDGRPYFVVPCERVAEAWDLLMKEPGVEGPPTKKLDEGLRKANFDITADLDWHDTVGEQFRGMDGVYRCTSYDSRQGFWMLNEQNPSDWRNVSERAIGRTYHRVYSEGTP